MFPLFTNSALLAGMAGLAAPILIHLLLRRKSQRLRFSTVRFFVKKDEQSSRKRKLRNLLLLTARLLLFALIVAAFARPFLPGNNAAAALRKQQQVIVLLDASASMQATGAAGQQWARAKELARQTLSSLQSDDRAALVVCASPATTISPFAPGPVVARALADLQPTFGPTDLAEGLRHARKLAATANPSAATSLCLISDLQKNSSQNLATIPLPASLPVKILDLGERFIPNIAVSELQLAPLPGTDPHARMTSFSDEKYASLSVRFALDNKELVAKSVELPAAGTVDIPLAVPILAPGWHSAEFAVQAKDGLKVDDTRYETLFVPEPTHVLLVETRRSPRSFQEATFFLSAALDPNFGTTGSGKFHFAIEKTSLEALAQKLSPVPGQPRTDLVILPGIKQFSAATVSSLTAYVQNGGGLICFLDESVSPNRYNSELGQLLPAQIGNLETTREGDNGWRMANYKQDSIMFKPFSQPNTGNLTLPEFRQRFALTLHPGSVSVAEFDDATPAIVESKFGQGRVALIDTSTDTSWSDWPKHKTFVPWLHGAARQIAGRTATQESASLPAYVCGSEIDLDLSSAKSQKLTLQRPGKPDLNLTSDADGKLRNILLDVPGIYSIKNGAGQEVHRLAVNLPALEADLASLSPTEFERLLTRKAEPVQPVGMASLLFDSNHGKELWRILLLSALALMLIEPLFANRTVA